MKRGKTHTQLTEREKEVLTLLVEGNTVEQAGKHLNISSGAIQSHKVRIMLKLNIHNLAGLVKYALRNNLIPLTTEENNNLD